MPAPLKCEFHFDFGSPNAYLSHKVIPGIEARTGARFDYVPVLLGGIFKLTGNQSPATAFAQIRNKPDYERLEMRRFIEKHGLTAFRMNTHFPVNTLQLMRGAVAAQQAAVAAQQATERNRYTPHAQYPAVNAELVVWRPLPLRTIDGA